MTARSFTFGTSLTAMLNLIDTVARVLTRASDLPRLLGRPAAVRHWRTVERRQLQYFDDRMLRDLGLRRDQFPSAARERLRDAVLYFHF